MKHIKAFNHLLNDVVNLNQTRLSKLETAVPTVTKAIKDSSQYGSIYKKYSSQGSYGHRTIIKPVAGREFDADVVIFVDQHDEWGPKDYIHNIYQVFKNHPTYKDKVHYNTRCISLDYADDMHIDLVPCIVEETIGWLENFYTYSICNRSTNEYESTDPEAYKAWISGKNKTTGNNNLIKSIRLFKYLRDIKCTFSCKSILLTTLLGKQVMDSYDLFSEDFKDLPTSFRTLINRLDHDLQQHSCMPDIENPVQSGEYFTRHWNETKFQNFRVFVSKYTGWVNEAYEETDKNLSIEKWRKVFGDQFFSVKATQTKKSESVSLEALNERFVSIPSHYLPHPWKSDGSEIALDVEVKYKQDFSQHFVNKLKFGSLIPKKHNLRFEIINNIDEMCEIYWQVTNTGAEAAAKGQLRGGFELGKQVREESTSYKGDHFVEAFVVHDNVLLARSEKIIISIS
ncbi:conserved hypothetical protein [Vibrio coralliirubri]|uniref:SMODS domain-containing nucleotidyltransferase n=1 Tax=Vibrio TaxID=662 RepID=UPI0006378BC0|nr:MULTISPECIES: nucleotidyltransferase [Vibrio]PMI65098.1 hypothetical protein BCU40_19345 [Vibrio lentus]CDT79766.1 conserved hypothetical protein [Vibrio coralliirubri]CDT97071.1 conserved hypothetical protein [Vibrio coralliirubri]